MSVRWRHLTPVCRAPETSLGHRVVAITTRATKARIRISPSRGRGRSIAVRGPRVWRNRPSARAAEQRTLDDFDGGISSQVSQAPLVSSLKLRLCRHPHADGPVWQNLHMGPLQDATSDRCVADRGSGTLDALCPRRSLPRSRRSTSECSTGNATLRAGGKHWGLRLRRYVIVQVFTQSVRRGSRRCSPGTRLNVTDTRQPNWTAIAHWSGMAS